MNVKTFKEASINMRVWGRQGMIVLATPPFRDGSVSLALVLLSEGDTQVMQAMVPLLPLGRGNKHSLGSMRGAGRWRALCNGKWELEVLLCSCTEAIFLRSKHGLWAPHLLMSRHLSPGAQLVLGVTVNRSLPGFFVFCFENITSHGMSAK